MPELRMPKNAFALNINRDEGLENQAMQLANLGVAFGRLQTFLFFPTDSSLTRVCIGSEGKTSTENSKAEPTAKVSTHQTEFVLHGPGVCHQFSPRVHFQNISSRGAQVEEAVITGHLGVRGQRNLKTWLSPVTPMSPGRDGMSFL